MDEGRGDPFDDLVLDAAWIEGAPREASADERAERLARIAAGHAAATAWRAPPSAAPLGRARHARAPRRWGTVLTVLAVTLGALTATAWWQGSGPFAPPAPVAGPAAPAPAPPPPPDPVRLAPLPPDPGGVGGHVFSHEQEGLAGVPVAYDPCRPVRWTARRDGEPPGGILLVEQAVAEISAATGLVFVREPDTEEPPSTDRDVFQPERYGAQPAPVLVAWSDERTSPVLADDVAGYAGSTFWGYSEPGTLRYVTGLVVLDGPDAAQVLERPGGEAAVRSTVLHELGHLVGLGHVDDPAQLMFPEGSEDRLALSDGDRRGLRAVGAGRCFTDWDRFTPESAARAESAAVPEP